MNNRLNDQIANDLKAKIMIGSPVPEPFTLMNLSDFYQVSITPVRQAIDSLMDEGIIIKQENGRLKVHEAYAKKVSNLEGSFKQNATKKTSESIGLQLSASDKIEKLLIREIIRESIQGKEIFLREEATSEKYNVGRTIIRQVFGRLADKNIIDHVPRRGWKIRPFKSEELESYLQVREIMELKALDLAKNHLDEISLKEMLSGNTSSVDDPDRIDNNLHRYIIEKSQNLYIQDFFAKHGVYFTELFDFATPEADYVQEMAEQHRLILTSLIEKDYRAAKKHLSEHIKAQKTILDKIVS